MAKIETVLKCHSGIVITLSYTSRDKCHVI